MYSVCIRPLLFVIFFLGSLSQNKRESMNISNVIISKFGTIVPLVELFKVQTEHYSRTRRDSLRWLRRPINRLYAFDIAVYMYY